MGIWDWDIYGLMPVGWGIYDLMGGAVWEPASLLMGSFPLKTIVYTWQHFHLFFKPCTKGKGVTLHICAVIKLECAMIKSKLGSAKN